MERICRELKRLHIEFATDLPLSAHSSFRIGGRADLSVFPRTREQLLDALSLLRDSELPMQVIGNGSNVVFSDAGFRGAIVFTSSYRELLIQGEELLAGAGTLLSSLAVAARDASLGGAEFAHGIPGTLGGAVYMNAGAYGGSMADICVASEYFDTESGACGVLTGDGHAFDYRTSTYEKNPSLVLLTATLRLRRGNREEIQGNMKELMERRKASQPLEYPSAGSVFKRPKGHFAGKLIEDCGLKGLRIGGAEVSTKHAGFIVNRGGATASDVRALVEVIKERVWKETGVSLECEIRFI